MNELYSRICEVASEIVEFRKQSARAINTGYEKKAYKKKEKLARMKYKLLLKAVKAASK